jgi:MtfA peptidase
MSGSFGDHAFAGFVGALVGVFVGWVAHGASGGSLAAALGAGVAATALLYVALTHRLRRRAKAAEGPLPDWWRESLDERLPYFWLLDSERQERFLRRCKVFLAEQRITGVGCSPTDEDRLLIAATAVMMTEGYPDFHFPTTREVLVYADSFDPEDFEVHDEGEFLGQVLDAGPVLLSLPELRRGFTDEDWTNVVVHELSHVLDAMWGSEAGGFGSDEEALVRKKLADKRLWRKVRRGDSPIDDYAFENEQEFFAVTSEVFFEDPELLAELHPEIYAWLARVYRQDLVALMREAERRERQGSGVREPSGR